MSPLKHSKNFAARMGRWSASHWKTAVAGWLAFVALSVFVGMQVGTTQIDRNDANVGESRTADRIISDAGFAVDENGESIDEQGEMVLLQSKTLTVNDAAFRVAIADTVRALQAFPKVTKLRSPLAADHADLVSKDSHSALIQFTPTGTYDEVVLYIDTILSAVDRVQAAHTGFYIHSAGVSTDKALDKEIQGGLGKAGLISIPLTILILMIVLGSLVGAMIPLLVALSAIAATTGLLALSSQAIPASDSIMEVILLIGLAVGVDYSLFYMRREREERRAGRSATAALEAAAATSGRAVLISGITVLIAMAGMFLYRRQDLHVLLGRRDARRRRRDDRLAHRPACRARQARRRCREGAGFRSCIASAASRATVASGMPSSTASFVVRSSRQSPQQRCCWSWRCRPSASTRRRRASTASRARQSSRSSELIDAFPGAPDPAVVAIKADDVNSPAGPRGDR